MIDAIKAQIAAAKAQPHTATPRTALPRTALPRPVAAEQSQEARTTPKNDKTKEAAAVAELARTWPPSYHASAGASTLGTTRVYHLQPEQQQRLHVFLEAELNAVRHP